jgi:hypothetical protein
LFCLFLSFNSYSLFPLQVDHLLDRAAALTGKSIKSRGITSTQLTTWKKVRRVFPFLLCGF